MYSSDAKASWGYGTSGTPEGAKDEAANIKVCPRCGATLFSDMNTCYGCLYSFDEKQAPEPAEEQPKTSAYVDQLRFSEQSRASQEPASRETLLTKPSKRSALLDSALPRVDQRFAPKEKISSFSISACDENPFADDEDHYFAELAFENQYADRPVCTDFVPVERNCLDNHVKTVRLKMGEVLEIQINA